jgi:hypothetical protein
MPSTIADGKRAIRSMPSSKARDGSFSLVEELRNAHGRDNRGSRSQKERKRMARKKRFTPENFGFIEADKGLWLRRVSRKPLIKYCLHQMIMDGHYIVEKTTRDRKDRIPDAQYEGPIPDDEFAAQLFKNMGMLPFTGQDSNSE